jgi:hypothetical protein
MRDVPDPVEYDAHTETIRLNEVLVVEYPNSIIEIHIGLDGVHANIDEIRRKNDSIQWDECTNCNDELKHRETALDPCQDCFDASLKAAEQWAAEHTDELLGDALTKE